MNQIVAIVDVGSNSVRLLVADLFGGQARCLHQEKITCRLLSGFQAGRLSPEALARTGDAIEALAQKARALGATSVVGFGTSAMRDGQNRDVLIERARQCGVALSVMSGTQEAALAYAGASPEGRCGVLDIGGGSTELMTGAHGHLTRAFSAQIGAVRLFEAQSPAHPHETPPDALVAQAKRVLSPAWDAVRDFPVDHWVGVGGTITALASLSMALNPYDPERVQGYCLTRQAVKDWLTRLAAMPLSERRRLPGLNPERADIIPCGAAILTAFFDLTAVPCLYASDRDNLLGFAKTL
ncbi:MAG: Ppx/GppA family phosphatase [Clostridia bacterium]